MNVSVEKIKEICLHASDVILEVYNREAKNIKVLNKDDKSPLTEADLEANKIITNGLKKWYPTIPIISEENQLQDFSIRKNWPWVWLVDPLDGTKEFLNKTDEFTINIALIHNQICVAGFVFVPCSNSYYYASINQGAFKESDNKIEQLGTSTFELSDPKLNVLASRDNLDENTLSEILKLNKPNIITAGSALKFMKIAEGTAHYYPRLSQIMEWDTAASQIIIEEAGGSLMDYYTQKPLIYNKESMYSPYFIASGNPLPK